MNKEEALKEKFKIALTSTIKVISEKDKVEVNFENKNLGSKNLRFFDLDNLKNIDDYTKIRAETDSEALKLRYSNKKIYQKNLPKTSTTKSLYNLTEKIRYEKIGSDNLKGIKQNLLKNYEFRQKYKRKDQLNTKEDVSAKEAFELYLLKHFYNVRLTKLSKEILGFWEKIFDQKLNSKIDFFKQNIHNQEIFNSTFSKIIENMDIGENSEEKILKKHCDWIIANDVSKPGIGFDSDFNEVSIVYKDKNKKVDFFSKRSKSEIAKEIAEKIIRNFSN